MLTRDDDYFVPLAHARCEGAPRAGGPVRVDPRRRVPRGARARLVGVRAVRDRRDVSAAARWLAQKENEADLIGGVNLDVQDPVLARTLLDLSQTAQINDSLKVGRHVLSEIAEHNTLHKSAVEQAGFAVLKAPDIPSILVETAFISNPDEELKLRSDRHQQRFAESIGDGIRRYFAGESAAGAREQALGRGRIPPVLRFFVTFLLLQALLFGLELTPWAQEYFVVPWTNTLARISTWLVTVFDPNVMAVGKIMRSTTNGFAVSIEAGCNGVEATIVLLAAILAFPAPWKHKLVGLAVGIVAVQGLNVVRVISLFYLGQWDSRVVRVGAPLRLAGADHARRADRLAGLGAHAAAHDRCRAARISAARGRRPRPREREESRCRASSS